jgi:hypothetical protein
MSLEPSVDRGAPATAHEFCWNNETQGRQSCSFSARIAGDPAQATCRRGPRRSSTTPAPTARRCAAPCLRCAATVGAPREHKLWSGTDSGGLLDTALWFALGAGRGSIVAPAAIPGHLATSYGFPRQPPPMREVASCPPLRPSLGLGIAADLVKHPLAPWTLPLAWQPRTKRIMTQERAQDAAIAASQDVCHRIDGQRGHVAAASAVGTLPPSDPPTRALDHPPIQRAQ